jgi:uncharacterized protein
MAVDHIRYDLLAQEALRGVVRTVLEDAAKNGLPGDHHFYITFDTRAEGVRLSQRMRTQYPAEMTIILQHQFWDLLVGEEGFEVGLSFGGVAERLSVPFTAIKGFFDPSVQFGLQFGHPSESAEEQSSAQQESPTKPAAEPVPTRSSAPKQAPPAVAPPAVSFATAESKNDPDRPIGGGEVVRLDRFRKK